jgi:hypothetical protein
MYFINSERAEEFLHLISPFYDTCSCKVINQKVEDVETIQKDGNSAVALDNNDEHPSSQAGEGSDEKLIKETENESDEDDEVGATQNWPYKLVWNEEQFSDLKLRFLGPGK